MARSRQLAFFLSELKRRRVFQIAGGYAILAWGAIQVTETTYQYIGLPPAAVTFVIVIAVACFPVALVVAWVYELTPAGLRRDEADGPGRSRDARIWTATFLAAGLLLLVGFGAGRQLGRNALVPPVAPSDGAAPSVAVLPFDIVGHDLDMWPEGIVYLLSFNLDGMASLRKIDPAVVFAALDRRAAGTAPLTAPAARAIAADVGATYVVTGNVVRTGQRIRITAEAHDVARGTTRGSVSVDVAMEGVQLAVDRLAMALLADGVIPVDSVPQPVRLAELVTSSLPALKAYLEGEWHFRRSRFTDAAREFRRAVELDSTFARAHYRLAAAYVWTHENRRSSDHLAAAARHTDRLPPRDALLVTGTASSGARAIELLEELTRRYPDDVDGWYELGEAYFHYGGASLLPSSAYRTAWTTALRWGRPYGESFVHLVEDAFAHLDSARARTLIDQMNAVAKDAQRCAAFDVIHTLVWGDAAAGERARTDLDRIPFEALECAWSAIAAAPAAVRRMEELDRAHLRDGSMRALWRNLQSRAVRGEIRAARDILAAVEGHPLTGRDAAHFQIMLHISGYPDPASVARAHREISRLSTPLDHFWIGALAGAEQRWSTVDSIVRALESQATRPVPDAGDDTLMSPDHARAFADALRAWSRFRRDRQDTGEELESALRRMPQMSYRSEQPQQFLRYDAALALLDRQEPVAAERYLRSFYFYDYVYFAPVQYHLAVIHEARGEIDQALAAYTLFARWWQDCDPELTPMRNAAVTALARLRTHVAAS